MHNDEQPATYVSLYVIAFVFIVVVLLIMYKLKASDTSAGGLVSGTTEYDDYDETTSGVSVTKSSDPHLSTARNYTHDAALEYVATYDPNIVKELNSVVCGLKHKKEDTEHSVQFSNNPWLVQLYVHDDYACTGVLLTNKWILSAAYDCLQWDADGQLRPLVAVFPQRKHSKQILYRIVKVVVPMDARIYENSDDYYEDIGLYYTDKTIETNKQVSPICSHFAADESGDLFINSTSWKCNVVSITTSDDQPTEFKSADMNPAVSRECVIDRKEPWLICATVSSGFFCSMDHVAVVECASIFDSANDIRWQVFGITQSLECNQFSQHITFTNINYYREWIERVVSLNESSYGDKIFDLVQH